MFRNPNYLNEGSLLKSSGVEQNKILNEGENPKSKAKNELRSSWQKMPNQTHVNLSLEKLRK